MDLAATLKRYPLLMLAFSYCPHTRVAELELKKLRRLSGTFSGLFSGLKGKKVKIIFVDELPGGEAVGEAIKKKYKRDTLPLIFIKGKPIGGSDKLKEMRSKFGGGRKRKLGERGPASSPSPNSPSPTNYSSPSPTSPIDISPQWSAISALGPKLRQDISRTPRQYQRKKLDCEDTKSVIQGAGECYMASATLVMAQIKYMLNPFGLDFTSNVNNIIDPIVSFMNLVSLNPNFLYSELRRCRLPDKTITDHYKIISRLIKLFQAVDECPSLEFRDIEGWLLVKQLGRYHFPMHDRQVTTQFVEGRSFLKNKALDFDDPREGKTKKFIASSGGHATAMLLSMMLHTRLDFRNPFRVMLHLNKVTSFSLRSAQQYAKALFGWQIVSARQAADRQIAPFDHSSFQLLHVRIEDTLSSKALPFILGLSQEITALFGQGGLWVGTIVSVRRKVENDTEHKRIRHAIALIPCLGGAVVCNSNQRKRGCTFVNRLDTVSFEDDTLVRYEEITKFSVVVYAP